MANTLYSGSPYGAMVLGNIANKKNNNDEAVKYWQAAATAAATDTVYRDVQRQVLGNIASVLPEHRARRRRRRSRRRSRPRRRPRTRTRSSSPFRARRGTYLYGGRQNLQQALLIAGDTAARREELRRHAHEPDGVRVPGPAQRGGRRRCAPTATPTRPSCSRTCSQVNPYNRDALFNLAVTYLNLGQQNERCAPLVTRLVAVDPGNPENYLLAARAYVDLAKTREGSCGRRGRTTTRRVSWFNRGSEAPGRGHVLRVLAGREAARDRRHTCSIGATRRRRRSRRSTTSPAPRQRARRPRRRRRRPRPPCPPKAVTLKFEALDKAGAVLGTQTRHHRGAAAGQVRVVPREDRRGERGRVSLHDRRLIDRASHSHRRAPASRRGPSTLEADQPHKLGAADASEVLDSA